MIGMVNDKDVVLASHSLPHSGRVLPLPQRSAFRVGELCGSSSPRPGLSHSCADLGLCFWAHRSAAADYSEVASRRAAASKHVSSSRETFDL